MSLPIVVLVAVVLLSLVALFELYRRKWRYNKVFDNYVIDSGLAVQHEEEYTSKARVVTQSYEQQESDSAMADLGFDATAAVLTQPLSVQKKPTIKTSKKELLVFYIKAKNGLKFAGYELLQVLLTLGFRYGDMNIFHRHENRSGRNVILFSLANATEPGSFDINNMGALNTSALSIFMKIKPNQDSVNIFDGMMQVLQQIAEELDGEIQNEQHQLLSQDEIENTRDSL